jgi:hypothetical protein
MKIPVKKGWNFIRILRLVIGIAGTIQGFLVKEFALSLAGFFLVYMVVADVGYFGAGNCEVELKGAKSTLKKTDDEKVDARL